MKLKKIQTYKAIIYIAPGFRKSKLWESIQRLLIPPKTLNILIKGFCCKTRIELGKVGVDHPFLAPIKKRWKMVFFIIHFCEFIF